MRCVINQTAGHWLRRIVACYTLGALFVAAVATASTASAVSTLTVSAVTASTNAVTPVNVNVLASVSDPGFSVQVQSINTSATKGTAKVLADGRIGYNPFHAFDSLTTVQTGLDTVGYTVVDSSGATKTATLTIQVTGTLAPPASALAVPAVTASTNAATPVNVNVLTGVSDPGHTFKVQSISTSATKGLAALLSDGRIAYNPDHAFDSLTTLQTGLDTVGFTVVDSAGATKSATLTVQVTGAKAVQLVASAVSATTTAVAIVDIDVLSHASGSAAVISLKSIDSTATLGSVAILADQRVAYNPNHAFDLLTVNETGSDSFKYTVADSAGNQATAVVTVRITGVLPVNNPIATPVTITTIAGTPINITVLNNVYEPIASYTPTVTAINTTGTKGTVKILTDGSSRIGYFPPTAFAALTVGQSAVDTLGYTVSDGHGASASSTVTVYVTPANSSAAAASVDFSKPVWSQSMSGFLDSLTQLQPGSGVVTPVKPGILRGGDASNYARALAFGSAYEYVLSEGWGYPQSNWNGRGAPYQNWAAWEAYVKSTADQNKNANFHWAVWNQPEWYLYWDGTPAQLYETYLRAYLVLRQELGPNAMIGGPSVGLFSWSYIKGLADYCLANGCEINWLAWQELTGSPLNRMNTSEHLDIAASVLMNNPTYAALNIKERIIDEMDNRADQYNPAEMLADLTALENGGADYAVKSCWANNAGVSNCFNNSLDGLLTDAQTPRAGWWAYKYYADGVGNRVQASSADPHLVVRASRVGSGAQVLIGYYAFDVNTSLPRTVTLSLSNLASAGFPAGTVVPVNILKIAATGEAAMASPSLVGQTTIVSGASASLTLPALNLHETLVVQLAP